MATLVCSATTSLDGFVAGPGGDMSWLGADLPAIDVDLDALTAGIGALLIGRRTYGGDDPNRGTDAEGAFGGRWHGPSFVLTHRPPEGPAPSDVTFLDDLDTAVARAREAAGEREVHVLGADVSAGCLAAGHLDELLIYTAPILLGAGTPLFRHEGGTRIHLDPIPPGAAGPDARRYRVRR